MQVGTSSMVRHSKNATRAENHHLRPPSRPESPARATLQASAPTQSRPSETAVPHPQHTSPTEATGSAEIQAEVPLKPGRPKRNLKPVQRYGTAEADQENTSSDDSTKTKGKSLSPKQREKRKAEARKRDKTKREA